MMDVGEGSTGDPRDIEEIVSTLHRAGEAVGREADGVLAMFHPDPSTVLFDYLAPGLTSLDELRQTATDLAERATGIVFSYPKVTVHVLSDDVAYSMAYSHLEATLADGPALTVNSRVTTIWQRIDGRWRAIHEHSSVPVDLATGTADLTQPI
jgi:ketosteroid isomerase-like protein